MNRMSNYYYLSKEIFNKTLEVNALTVPIKQISFILKEFKDFILSKPRLKNVIPDNKKDYKKILLNEKIKLKSLEGLPEKCLELIKKYNFEITTYQIQLNFDNFTLFDILNESLPKGISIPGSFETIGHIAHLNLRKYLIPYKYLIGQAILEKNNRIRTVVNKIGKIETPYRTFEMEILAGENNLKTEVYENKCTFQFDFSLVYWNSRLQCEHERLINLFHKHDVICDMFAGVGPFSIPAAKNIGCTVYANDLNPQSYYYLKQNVILNKVQSIVHCFNMDARDFIFYLVYGKKPSSIHEDNNLQPISTPIRFSQIIMNLPASAIQFLDVFKNLFKKDMNFPLPIIHCYSFSTSENPEKDIISKIENILGETISPIHIYEVRDVSPKKRMLCISFQLPKNVSFQDENMQYDNFKRKDSVEYQNNNLDNINLDKKFRKE